MNKWLWIIEENNAKLRKDIRRLLKAWRDKSLTEVKKIYSEVNEIERESW